MFSEKVESYNFKITYKSVLIIGSYTILQTVRLQNLSSENNFLSYRVHLKYVS